jgi:hypothetical protein
MRCIGATPCFSLNVRIASPNQDLAVFDPPGLNTLVRNLLQSTLMTLSD